MENINDNYYEFIGVKQDATVDDIRRKCNKLLLKYHPDKCNEDFADGITKHINKIKATLCDPDKKVEYNKTLSEEKRKSQEEKGKGEKAEQKAREETEKRAKEEAKRRAKEKAEQKAREETERRAKEETERLRKQKEEDLERNKEEIIKKQNKTPSKKILFPVIILCLLLFMLFVGQSLIHWNNEDSKNKENIPQEIQSVPKETNSIIQKTDNTASYAKDEKTVESEQSPVICLPGNIWYSISDASGVYTAWGRILREPNSYYQNGLYISGEVFYKPVMDENPDSQPQGEGYDMNIEIKNSGGLPFIFNEAQVNINDGKIEYFALATTTKDTHKSNVIIENGGTQQFNIQSRAIELKMQPNYSEDNKLAMHFSLYHFDSGVSEPQNAVASFHAILPDYSTVKAGVWIPIEFTDFYSAQAAAYSKEESDLALIRTDKK